jgi:hypothetical protein
MSIKPPEYFPTFYGCDGVVNYPSCRISLLEVKESMPDITDEPLVIDYAKASIKFSLNSIECYLDLIKQKDLESIDKVTLINIGRTLLDVANALRAIEDNKIHVIINDFNFGGDGELTKENADAIKSFVEKRAEQIERNRRGV